MTTIDTIVFEPAMARHVVSNDYKYRIVEHVPGQGRIAFYYRASEYNDYQNEIVSALEHNVLESYGARIINAR